MIQTMHVVNVTKGPSWWRRFRMWYLLRSLRQKLARGELVIALTKPGDCSTLVIESVAPGGIIYGDVLAGAGHLYHLKLNQLVDGPMALCQLSAFEPKALKMAMELIAQRGHGCIVTNGGMNHPTITLSRDCWLPEQVTILQFVS